MSESTGVPTGQRGSRTQRVRMNVQWPVVVLLAAVWVMLWGDLSVFNVICGVLVALAVMIVFPLPPLHFTGRVSPRGVLVLVAVFLWDLVRASAQVAAQALDPRYHPRNAVIAVRLLGSTDACFLLTSELVSLVPGSLLLETDYRERILYLHVLGVQDDADIERSRRRVLDQERRIVRAIGSAEERSAVEEAR